jgi:hypothetical protein
MVLNILFNVTMLRYRDKYRHDRSFGVKRATYNPDEPRRLAYPQRHALPAPEDDAPLPLEDADAEEEELAVVVAPRAPAPKRKAEDPADALEEAHRWLARACELRVPAEVLSRLIGELAHNVQGACAREEAGAAGARRALAPASLAAAAGACVYNGILRLLRYGERTGVRGVRPPPRAPQEAPPAPMPLLSAVPFSLAPRPAPPRPPLPPLSAAQHAAGAQAATALGQVLDWRQQGTEILARHHAAQQRDADEAGPSGA